MKNKFKIRWWVLVITGIIFHYVFTPLLVKIYFTPPIKSGLMLEAWLVALLPDAGDLLVLIGVIIGIVNFLLRKIFQKQHSDNDDQLSYLRLIKYAIKNISKIHRVEDVVAEFGESIKDITDERMKTPEFLFASVRFLGQKSYFFSFKDGDFWGEFNLDFLPEDHYESVKRHFENLTKQSTHDKSTGMDELANFRIQLFSKNQRATKKEYDKIFNFLNSEYDQPNTSETALIIKNTVESEHGKFLNAWDIVSNSKNYSITFYKQISNNNIVPDFLAFSISRTVMFNTKEIPDDIPTTKLD